MNTVEKKKSKKKETKAGNPKKSKFALYWEANQDREPWFEIVDMRAVLR